MSTRVKCRICGKRTRYQDGLCNVHRTLLPQHRNTEDKPAEADNKEEKPMKKVIDWILRIFGVILIIALILFAGWAIRGCTATPVVATETTAAATAAPVETTAATTAATVETVTAETAATAVASNGIDYPSKTWLFVQSGTVVSGDIAVFDNDNNSKKTPIYDSAEGTADIIYFTQDIYIWAEWGCHVVANPTQDQIDNLINSKLQEFRTVRYFSNFTKLGENTPIIYGEALPAA